MKRNTEIIRQVEESLNTMYYISKCTTQPPRMFVKRKIDLTQALTNHPEGISLYDMICEFIRRMRKPCFINKNGVLKESKFYDYAMISKNTWSNIRLNTKTPNKKTLLRLVFALQLNYCEAQALLNKASNSFTDTEMRDRIAMALIDMKCYDRYEVWNVMDVYGKNKEHPFENIYPEPE